MNIRKFSTYLLVFLVFSCTTNNSKRKTDLEKLNLSGNVKSYIKTIYRTSDSKNDSTELPIQQVFKESFLFNEQGNILEENSFSRSGKLYKIWISEYDTRSNDIRKVEIKLPNDTLRKSIKKYDRNGNEIEHFSYFKDSLTNHSKSFYDNNNNRVELKILKSKKIKNQTVKAIYEYDEYGNEIKKTTFFSDKSKTEWFTKYDSIGNETEWRVYDRNGNLERIDSTNYIYYNNGKIKEEKMFSSVDIPGVYGISKYNENGDEIEYVEYLNDSITSKEIYIYDNSGSQITKYYDSNGELESTVKLTSEFDNNGNLIKESEYENGKLRTIKEYKIEYYK